MRRRCRQIAGPVVLAVLAAGCGTAQPASTPVATTPATVLEVTCTQAPVTMNGRLTAEMTTSLNGRQAGLRLTIDPFTGKATYAATRVAATSTVVWLRTTATAADQARVLGELRQAPGVTTAEMIPPDPGIPPGTEIRARVTVARQADLDRIPATVETDPAVNQLVSGNVFEAMAQNTKPLYVDLSTGSDSVPLHAISGSATASADATTGRFDVVVTSPYDTTRSHLSGTWTCPSPPPSIGTAGRSLGTPAVTVTPNDQGTGFSPGAVSVKVGDIVEWSVTGTVPHNVMFTEDPNVSINLLQHGDSWQVRFTRPGTYHYHCTFHGESGTVTVTP